MTINNSNEHRDILGELLEDYWKRPDPINRTVTLRELRVKPAAIDSRTEAIKAMIDGINLWIQDQRPRDESSAGHLISEYSREKDVQDLSSCKYGYRLARGFSLLRGNSY